MRPVLALVICTALLGGLSLYMHTRGRDAGTAEHARPLSADAFTVEVLPGFRLEPNPFSFDSREGAGPVSLLLQVDGREIARRTDALPPGEPYSVGPITGLQPGVNELYVEASPPVSEATRFHGLRVRVLSGEIVMAEGSFWADPGALVTGTLYFRVPAGGGEGQGHGG